MKVVNFTSLLLNLLPRIVTSDHIHTSSLTPYQPSLTPLLVSLDCSFVLWPTEFKQGLLPEHRYGAVHQSMGCSLVITALKTTTPPTHQVFPREGEGSCPSQPHAFD